jgi:hypothetical protein
MSVSGLQQRQQTALAVEGHQIVTTAYMGVTDENLGHRAAACDFHHVGTRLGVSVDAHFFNVCHAFGGQQLFGTDAIRANGGGVHLDGLHAGLSEVIRLWRQED